jgi:cbb3-type cytochrome oxidase maturation protein
VTILWITIPASLALAGTLLAWVLHEVLRGGFDDFAGAAERALLDDDRVPERASDYTEAP